MIIQEDEYYLGMFKKFINICCIIVSILSLIIPNNI
jgi:hypothetical protein